jgi:hypothetical protein
MQQQLPLKWLPQFLHLLKRRWAELKQNTDKKENQSFLIFKQIQNGAVAKSYMRKSFLVYEEMSKYLTIDEEAVCHI